MLVGVLHLRSGNLAAAEAAFRRQIELGGPDGASFMRYRGHTMLGDVHAAREETDAAMAAYRRGAARGKGAAASASPDNASYQRELSVTCDRIGDMHARKRDLGAALASYRSGLEIVEGLAAEDPENAVWQHDLSVSHDRIGEVLDKQGDRAAALASFSKGLAIAQALAKREPESVQRAMGPLRQPRPRRRRRDRARAG